MDRTILIHQIEASRSRSDAEVLLLGDSSCLIDVSANQLTAEIVRPVLNLATFSYLDLNAQSVLLTNFIAANPNRLKAVVLLMHPEALRRESAASYYTNFVRRFLQGEDCFQPQNIRDRTSRGGRAGGQVIATCCNKPGSDEGTQPTAARITRPTARVPSGNRACHPGARA